MLSLYINSDGCLSFLLAFQHSLVFLVSFCPFLAPLIQVHVCPDAKSRPGEHQHHRHSWNPVRRETEDKQRSARRELTPLKRAYSQILSLLRNTDTPSLRHGEQPRASNALRIKAFGSWPRSWGRPWRLCLAHKETPGAWLLAPSRQTCISLHTPPGQSLTKQAESDRVLRSSALVQRCRKSSPMTTS